MLETITNYSYDEDRVKLDKIDITIKGWRLHGTYAYLSGFLRSLCVTREDEHSAFTGFGEASVIDNKATLKVRKRLTENTTHLPLFRGKLIANRYRAEGQADETLHIKLELKLNLTRLVRYQPRHRPATASNENPTFPALRIFYDPTAIPDHPIGSRKGLDRNDNVHASASSRNRAVTQGWESLLREHIETIESYIERQAARYRSEEATLLRIRRDEADPPYRLTYCESYWEVRESNALLAVDKLSRHVKQFCNDYAATDYALEGDSIEEDTWQEEDDDYRPLPAGGRHDYSSKAVRGGIAKGRTFMIYSKLLDTLRLETRTNYYETTKYGATSHSGLDALINVIRRSVSDSREYFLSLTEYLAACDVPDSTLSPLEFVERFYQLTRDINLAEHYLTELVVNDGIPNPTTASRDERKALERLQHSGLIKVLRRTRGTRYVIEPQHAHILAALYPR